MKRICSLLLAFAGIAVVTPLHSYDQSPACYRDMQVNFFRSDLVATALSLYNVRQNYWTLIYQDLQSNAPYIPARVQAKARALNPNPLDPVFLAAPAVNILQQSLYEVFSGVMQHYATASNNIIDQNTINGSFNYIWQQQSVFLSGCMR